MGICSLILLHAGVGFLATALGISPSYTTLPPPSSVVAKWIQSCSIVLVSMTAPYLTVMVMIECGVRILSYKAGLLNLPAVRNTQEMALDCRIEVSLMKIKIDPMHCPIDDSLKNVDHNSGASVSESESEIERANPTPSEDDGGCKKRASQVTALRGNGNGNTTCASGNDSDIGCCAICLEELDANTVCRVRTQRLL